MSRKTPLVGADRRAITAEAAVWFARIRSGECDERAFNDWFEESEAHRDAFNRILEAWDMAGALRAWFPDPARPAPDDIGGSEESQRPDDE